MDTWTHGQILGVKCFLGLVGLSAVSTCNANAFFKAVNAAKEPPFGWILIGDNLTSETIAGDWEDVDSGPQEILPTWRNFSVETEYVDWCEGYQGSPAPPWAGSYTPIRDNSAPAVATKSYLVYSPWKVQVKSTYYVEAGVQTWLYQGPPPYPGTSTPSRSYGFGYETVTWRIL